MISVELPCSKTDRNTSLRAPNLLSSNKNESRHIGIGSQASINVTTISVYKDAENNLMYNKTTLVYD